LDVFKIVSDKFINPLTYNDELGSSFISCATVDFDESDSSRAVFGGRRAVLLDYSAYFLDLKKKGLKN